MSKGRLRPSIAIDTRPVAPIIWVRGVAMIPRDRPVAWEFPNLRHIINRLLVMRVGKTLERSTIASPHLIPSKSGVFHVLGGFLARRVSRIADLLEVNPQNVLN